MGRIRQDDAEWRTVFGRGIQRIREARGMKQDTLAQEVGYQSHSQIAKIENGQTVPSFGKALQLAAFLQVTLEAIMRAGRGEAWEEAAPIPVLSLSLIVAQYKQVRTKTGELMQEMEKLDVLVRMDAMDTPTPPPSSGLEYSDLLPAYPDAYIAACA